MQDKEPIRVYLRIPRQKESSLSTIRIGGTPVIIIGKAIRGLNYYQLCYRVDHVGHKSYIQPILRNCGSQLNTSDKDIVVIPSKMIPNLEATLKVMSITLKDTVRVA